jgi:hypothetical protein
MKAAYDHMLSRRASGEVGRLDFEL